MIPFKPTDFEPRRYQPVEPLERAGNAAFRAVVTGIVVLLAVVVLVAIYRLLSPASAAQPAHASANHQPLVSGAEATASNKDFGL